MSLSLSLVADLIASQFPEFAGAKIRRYGEDKSFEVFQVDDAVFRFPRGPEAQKALAKEIAVLNVIGDRLSLRAPQFRWLGQPADGLFEFSFAGYPLISGRPLSESSPNLEFDLRGFAVVIADFLVSLHGAILPLGVPIPVLPCDRQAAEDYQRESLDLLDELHGSLPSSLFSRARDFLLNQDLLRLEYKGPLKLIHNGLQDNRILINEIGLATVVTDFSDLVWGDPALDFSGLFISFGDAWLAPALQRYRERVPCEEAIVERIRLKAAYLSLLFLYGGVHYGTPHLRERGHRGLVQAIAPVNGKN